MLPQTSEDKTMSYAVEAFVDDYIAITIPTSQEQLVHVTMAVISGIHDVFPADTVDENNPTSLKKMKLLEAMWALEKDILGFSFDGVGKKNGWRKESKTLC